MATRCICTAGVGAPRIEHTAQCIGTAYPPVAAKPPTRDEALRALLILANLATDRPGDTRHLAADKAFAILEACLPALPAPAADEGLCPHGAPPLACHDCPVAPAADGMTHHPGEWSNGYYCVIDGDHWPCRGERARLAALPAPAADDGHRVERWRCPLCGVVAGREERDPRTGAHRCAADDAPRPADDEHRDALRRAPLGLLAAYAAEGCPPEAKSDVERAYATVRAALSGEAEKP